MDLIFTITSQNKNGTKNGGTLYIEPMEGVAFRDVNHEECRVLFLVRHISHLQIVEPCTYLQAYSCSKAS